MSIVRGPRPESNWYALDKRISEDTRLTWAARGLLVFLLGKPDSWRVSIEHLRAQTEGARVKTGRDGVYALLTELQAAGYVTTRRSRGDDGTLGAIDYIVRECPEASECVSPRPSHPGVCASPHPAEPDTAEPDTADPDTAEPTLVNTERASRTERAASIGASPSSDAPGRADPIPYQAIVDVYNETMTGLPKVRELTEKRKTLIRSAWRASPHRQSIAFWAAYFAECHDDPFLNGTGPYGSSHPNWRPTFDYLLRAEVVTRVYESAMDRLERGDA